MSKEKVYLTIIIGLSITLIIGCVVQSRYTFKKLSISEIIVPEQGLEFKTTDGKMIIKITYNKDGGNLSVHNNREEEVAGMGSSEDGGQVGVFNNYGKSVTVMSVHKYGGVLSIWNNNEGLVSIMCAAQDGGNIGICNNQGKNIWSKP